MNEILIVAADWYASAAPSQALAPVAGLATLARFANAETQGTDWRRLLCRRLGREALAELPPAVVAGLASRSSRGAAERVWIGTPVHFVLTRFGAHLPSGGVLELDDAACAALAESFAAELGGSGVTLEPVAGAFLVSAPVPAAETFDPARCIGLDVASHLPQGSGARALRQLGSEIELWLHEHPLNQARARARLSPLSTLWLWGGPKDDASSASERAVSTVASSVSPAATPAPNVRLFARDPVVAGLAAALGLPSSEPPAGFAALGQTRGNGERPGLDAVVLNVRDDFARLDAEWISPALDALRDGELACVSVVANDRCLSLRRRDLLKRWRRSRDALEVWR